jgi:hypothetical protein
VPSERSGPASYLERFHQVDHGRLGRLSAIFIVETKLQGALAAGRRIVLHHASAPATQEETMAKKSTSSGSKGRSKIQKVMKEHKEGKLKSGSGKTVKSRKQAVAIALSEARKSGAKIPKKEKKS